MSLHFKFALFRFSLATFPTVFIGWDKMVELFQAMLCWLRIFQKDSVI